MQSLITNFIIATFSICFRYVDMIQSYQKLKHISHDDTLMCIAALYKVGTPKCYEVALSLSENLATPSDRITNILALFALHVEDYKKAFDILNWKRYQNKILPKNEVKMNVILLALLKSGQIELCLQTLKTWWNLSNDKHTAQKFSIQIFRILEKSLTNEGENVEADETLKSLDILYNEALDQKRIDSKYVIKMVFRAKEFKKGP